MYKCECGREFEKPNSFNGHKSHCLIHARIVGKYDDFIKTQHNRHQNQIKTGEKTRNVNKEIDNKKYLLWISEKHVCENCGKIMTEKYASGRFCSRSCANSHLQTEEINTKRSLTVKSYLNDHPEWYGLRGKAPTENQKQYFSSKAERALRDFLKTTYPEYNFTTGAFVKYNNTMLNPDIYSRQLKIVIEYDGDWHFINIKNQLEHKQQKDKLLHKFIQESDYRLIRIDQNYKFTYDEICNYIFNSTDKIILLGNRYQYLENQ